MGQDLDSAASYLMWGSQADHAIFGLEFYITNKRPEETAKLIKCGITLLETLCAAWPKAKENWKSRRITINELQSYCDAHDMLLPFLSRGDTELARFQRLREGLTEVLSAFEQKSSLPEEKIRALQKELDFIASLYFGMGAYKAQEEDISNVYGFVAT